MHTSPTRPNILESNHTIATTAHTASDTFHNACGDILDSSHIDSSEVALVLMAAGSSSRFTQGFSQTHTHTSHALSTQPLAIKKQWLRIGVKPLWLFVADELSRAYPFTRVYITASPSDVAYMRNLCDYEIIQGGETRQESLQNALQHIHTKWVLVSDVARAGIVRNASNIISNLLAATQETRHQVAQAQKEQETHAQEQERIDCVVPFLAVADTTTLDDTYIDRQALRRIQTPQLSRVSALKAALHNAAESTDESSIIKANGGKIRYIQGDPLLEKLTFTSDMAMIESILAPYCVDPLHSSTESFVGNGLDIHEFMRGKVMKLGGVEIESEFGFKAHSDGDVALHSLIDAILGAMGAGDIGEWFPDSSAEYKGADSTQLLQKVWEFATSVGYRLHNADITIIAQIPKISPYKRAIQTSIANLLKAQRSRINIKATTAESLGFIGRKEGVCVISSVSLRLLSLREVAYLLHHSAESNSATISHSTPHCSFTSRFASLSTLHSGVPHTPSPTHPTSRTLKAKV